MHRFLCERQYVRPWDITIYQKSNRKKQLTYNWNAEHGKYYDK